MQLLFVIVNREEYLDQVISFFLEMGVTGATIIDSVGMGRIVAHDIPIFAGFRDLMVGNRPYNKTIFSVIDNDELIEPLIDGLENIMGNLDNPGTGLVFTVPINRIKGLGRGF